MIHRNRMYNLYRGSPFGIDCRLLLPDTGILWPWIGATESINLLRIRTDRRCAQRLLKNQWVDYWFSAHAFGNLIAAWDGISRIRDIIAAWDGLSGGKHATYK